MQVWISKKICDAVHQYIWNTVCCTVYLCMMVCIC